MPQVWLIVWCVYNLIGVVVDFVVYMTSIFVLGCCCTWKLCWCHVSRLTLRALSYVLILNFVLLILAMLVQPDEHVAESPQDVLLFRDELFTSFICVV